MNVSKAIVHSLSGPIDASHPEYVERVYAGVLGKLIGVYLGRPVENWSYERIKEEVGDITYYVHEQRKRLLIVTDDDISGTFTFLQSMPDHGNSPDITPEQIGETWLNYLIEGTTILWWGGLGNSTEHTAYLRLKDGVKAPMSGSAELNTRVVAEQIGSQIFIDGWGLICPGDPARAADFARRAASVSHDGEAIYAAQAIAAMVAKAFVEPDIDRLLNCALDHIPTNCLISALITDLREWHTKESDWRENRARLAREYSYERFGGQCPIVPNHGLIILGLLHGAGDFDRSLAIVNSSGWDTDCNSGNLGAILGVRNGLETFEKQDWRGPVADRLYLPSTDGGRAISDAVRETYAVANIARALEKLDPIHPKNGARFHFGLPGSVQGWQVLAGTGGAVSNPSGERLLIEGPTRASTPTFIPPEAKDMQTGYVLVASPTLYPGQIVRSRILATDTSAKGHVFISHYNPDETSTSLTGPAFELGAGEEAVLEWIVPDAGGQPIHEIGFELAAGAIELDYLTWDGMPTAEFPPCGGRMWARAWAKSLHRFAHERDAYAYLAHNYGIGLLTQGCREWRDYRVEATLTPRMAVSAGIAVRVQGLRRYYAFVFGEAGEIRIDKMLSGVTTLARTSFPWEACKSYDVAVTVSGNTIQVELNGNLVLAAVDSQSPLLEGAFGFVVESGCMGSGTPRIMPA